MIELAELNHNFTEQQLIAKWELAKRSKYEFLKMVYTSDPDEPDDMLRIIGKPFPYWKDYVQEFIADWERELRIIGAKTRQMILTWLCCACGLHDAITKPNQRICLRSDKLGKASKKEDELSLIGRVRFVIEHLPREFLEYCMGYFEGLGEPIQAPIAMWVLPNGTKFHCVSSAPKDVRGYTYTLCIDDELAHQQWAAEGQRALEPGLGIHGKHIIISSIKGKNEFYRRWSQNGKYWG